MYVALPLTATTFTKRKKKKKIEQQNADAHHLENK
jgi:hypothetical protein